MREGLFDGAAEGLFVDFSEFAADGDLAVAEEFEELGEGFDQAVWGFEDDYGACFGGEGLE